MTDVLYVGLSGECDTDSDSWSITPEAEYCTALEQLNRLLVGIVRQYGSNGALTLTQGTCSRVGLGEKVRWSYTGLPVDCVVIRELRQ